MSVNLKILIIKLQLFCIFSYLIFIITRVQFGTFDDNAMALKILVAISVATVLHFIQHKLIMGKLYYFSFSFLFPLGYLIVYFQLAILQVGGLSVLSQFENFIWGGSSNVSATISVSGLGLVAFFMGAVAKPSRYDSTQYLVPHVRALVKLITFLSYIFYIFFLINSGSYLSGAYVDDGTPLASYASKLFDLCLFAALCIELHRIIQSDTKRLTIMSYIALFYQPLVLLVVIHILMSIFVGDRGPVITLSILSFSAYFIKFYQLNFVKVLVIIVMLSTFFTILGEARTRVLGNSFGDRLSTASETSGESEYFDESVPGSSLIELALSSRTLAVSVRDVPSEFDYQYGMFQFQQLVSIVPGAQRLINNIVYDGNPIYDGSANFITYLIHRRSVDYGDGSSVIADLYLDFGIIGVVIVMFIFGRFISRIELDVHQRNIKLDLRFLAFMAFLSNAIYLSRSTIMLEFAGIILSYLLIKLIALFLDHRSNGRLRIS